MKRLAVTVLLFVALSARAQTFVVNSNADTDDGTCDANCTLREAINAANAGTGGTIVFAIGSGPVGITLSSVLPDLTTAIVIDGTTQPGYAGTPLVAITGVSTSSRCLVLRASNSAVRGLDIGNCFDGIAVLSYAGTAVSNIALERNFIGTRLATAPINSRAIWLDATGTSTLSNVSIGNATAAGRNVLATFGFVQDALAISGNTSDVTVAGNYFGINDGGTALQTAARFTTDIGVYASAMSSNITIGGSTSGARNVMASGGGTQVHIKIDSLGSGLNIEGNYIGTDAAGTTRMGASNFGVWFAGAGSATIRDNVIATTGGNAISTGISGRNIVVQGNLIGVKADGSGAFPFVPSTAIMDFGTAAPLLIGGPNPGDANVIANYSTGMILSTPGAIVQGNLFGLDPTGANTLGSGARGIACSFVMAEPPAVLRENKVAGFGSGIEIGNQGRATVENNFIGTEATGTAARPNTNGIVVLGDAGRTTISGNVISGNTANGILVSAGTMPVNVVANRIGLNAADAPLPNGGDGIRITSGTGAKNIGFIAGAANTIANNGGNGISVVAGSSVSILGNSIVDNAGLAIDLGTAGVTLNDPGDADTGANGLQNAPILTGASTTAGGTTVEGSLNSTANATFTIEIFANTNGDPSNHGEAQTFLARFNLSTDAGGNALFSTIVPLVAPGTILSATATSIATLETSEMSNDVTVVSGGILQFSAAATSVAESAGSLTITVTRTGGAGVPATVQYASSNGSAIAGSDYSAVAGTLSFAGADASQTFTVPISSDAVDEPDETFTLALTNVTGGTLGTPIVQTVTITDDDALPALSVSDASLIEGNAGTGILSFDVQLSAASAQTITVDYSTADQTASAGPDYGQRFGTLTFAPGETSKSVAVIVNGDPTAEADETLRLILTSAVNASLADGEGIGTIVNDDALPAISIGDVTVVEGDAGTSTATLTLALSNPGSAAVSVDWATNASSAGAGSDFTAAGGVVTFNPGVTAQTIDVTIAGDTIAEPLEQLEINLTNASGGTIGDAQALVTIADDDGEPSLTISNVAVDESAGTATLTVLLAPESAQTVTVVYDLADGTATGGSDYTDGSATLTFAPGVTTRTFTVPIANDALDEATETVDVALSAPSNASIADGTAMVTIVDDDGVPNASIDDVNIVEGNGGSTSATFTVTLSNPSASIVTMNWSASSGSAASGTDFIGASGNLMFSPGEVSKQVSVLVSGDVLDEPDETFFVTLGGASNANVTRPQGMGTIVNDDGTPALIVADAAVTEGDAGSAMASFVVTLAGSTAQVVSVDYAVADGTAVAGSDYASIAGQLTFAPGVTTKTIAVPVVADLSVESAETFFVNLSGAVNATISDGQALGTIANDDTAALVPSIAIADAIVTEGNAGTTSITFTVTLSTATTAAVTVDYATQNGTAAAGSDYAPASGTLLFAPGITSRAISIAVAGDLLAEGNETFVVNLTNPSNATLADGQALGTIANDDLAPAMPAIAIDGARVFEGDSGTRAAVFTVTLSTPAATTVTVDYATQNGTATAGSDYVAASATLAFSPGTTTRTVSIAILGDTIVESNETFRVRLSNATGATIGDAQATGTIVDDDQPVTPPELSIASATIVEGDSGAASIAFLATLSRAATTPVTVSYTTADGTATAGSDYVSAAGAVTFAAGESAQTINVAVLGDLIAEGDETFTIALHDANGATLAIDRATGTIQDDDHSRVRAVFVIAGSGPGNGGAFFRTQLQLHNRGNAPIAGELLVRPMDGSAARTVGYALDPHETRDFGPLLGGGFVTIDVAPLVGPLPEGTMRVFNDGGTNGAPGFLAPLIGVADAIRAGGSGLLIAPADAAALRYNIGIRALDSGASLTLTLRHATGSVAATITRDVPPNAIEQTAASALFATPLADNDAIEITSTRGAAIIYGSAIENTSQDPSMIIARPLP